jgi:iron complex outermembrane receptor protein
LYRRLELNLLFERLLAIWLRAKGPDEAEIGVKRLTATKLVSGFLFATGLIQSLAGQTQNQNPIDVRQASLEDLMDVTVTSVSKREQKLSRAASAIFVISQEDIRRSGATNIPDLLRMAPGVDVQQIDANAWAISMRGFSSRFANKVLVLIDGRTVYSPVFSGVYWDQLEMPLENIERIEVIRGPGATVWGANAVNGVISIITKSSRNTQGGQVTAGGGSQTHATGQLQYGGALGQSGTYRMFGDYSNIGNSSAQQGGVANDHWQRMQTGFRTDWDLAKSDTLMVQGDVFANQENQTTRSSYIPTPYSTVFPLAVDAAGGDFLALWNHTLKGGSQTSLQAYYDSNRRTDSGIPVKVTTFDLDFQHHAAVGDRHDIVWGLGYRADTSGAPTGYAVGFTPAFRTVSLFSVFLQDEIRISESLWFTLGAKLEHNAYTGFQVEPSARLAWAPPASRYTVWAAVSKAIRQPARADTDVQTALETFPLSASSIELVRLLGNPQAKAEELRDYELGYRSDLTKTLSLDVATFLSFYHHLETIEPQNPVIIPGSPLIIEIPFLYENKAHAMDYGAELSLTWKAAPRWRISPGYSYLHATIRQDPTSQGQTTASLPTDFPQSMFQIRSLFNLSRAMEFDQSLYYTARLPGGSIPGHARLDLRLARRLGESTEISVVGQNLLRGRTLEYGDATYLVGAEAVRSIYGKITFRF